MKFTSFAIVSLAAASPALAGPHKGRGRKMSTAEEKRKTLRRAAVQPERHLYYEGNPSTETKDDLKEDYDIKKKACYELNKCLEDQFDQVGKLYEYLQEPENQPMSPTLKNTLCAFDDPDFGLVYVADTIQLDQSAYCQKELSAECEFRKKEAELEGKVLFIELKEVVVGCAVDINNNTEDCLNDYDFDKREVGFNKTGYVRIKHNDYYDYGDSGPYTTCADLPGQYSVLSEYLGTPEPDVAQDVVFDFCDGY